MTEREKIQTINKLKHQTALYKENYEQLNPNSFRAGRSWNPTEAEWIQILLNTIKALKQD